MQNYVSLIVFFSIIKIMSVAFITGITGQDGSFLSEFLLEKGYIVYGLLRRNSIDNKERIRHLLNNPNLKLRYGDITDLSSLINILNEIKDNNNLNKLEIYNLCAQSDVKLSFEMPIYTAEVDALGTLYLLEAVRQTNLEKIAKIYQASTSELFGLVQEIPQTEKTPFYPRSPYGVAKLYAYWISKNYREAYKMFISNGILFNHESERRGPNFVTRKITIGLSKILKGEIENIELGNLDSKRDWGYTGDFIKGMWLILQQNEPDDFVLSTGETHSVREFIEEAFKLKGIEIEWQGTGLEEVGINKNNGKVVIRVSAKYFRPSEVDLLLGNSSYALNKLGWKPEITFKKLVEIMVNYDCN
jgi:GDPmannose 4,6-dehydratase